MGLFGKKDQQSKRSSRGGVSAAAQQQLQYQQQLQQQQLYQQQRQAAAAAAAASYAPPTTQPTSSSNTTRNTPTGGANTPVPAHHQHDQDDMVVVDRPPQGHSGGVDLDNDASKSYSRDAYEAQDHVTVADNRQNHLNSLFNGHLMKWKYEAEEGSAFIRVPAFCGALGLIVTAIWSLIVEPDAWTSHSIVMSVCVILMALFVLILDGRFMATNPLSARAHLRNIMTRNFNIFRFVWGRGLLYIAAGILNVAQMFLVTICSGATMIVIGIIALLVGVHASRKFAALRNSLADESFLLLVFSNYDVDGDGFIFPHEFALLLADLGMELDDRYTLKAFGVIDTDNDRKISFEEFSHWWAAGYIERGRRRRDEEEEEMYRRMG